MILLDTNVISELMRAEPAVAVLAWFGKTASASLFFSSIGEAELRTGAALLPAGERRDRLNAGIDAMIEEDFAGRLLSFDSAAAKAYAPIALARRRAGRPIMDADCQIAAIASANGAAVATRNVRDFEGCGVEVINRWHEQ